jgi:hypothetical protein
MAYDDAVTYAEDIKQALRNKTMPPWKPVAGFNEFLGSYAISDEFETAIGQVWGRRSLDSHRPLGERFPVDLNSLRGIPHASFQSVSGSCDLSCIAVGNGVFSLVDER